MAGMGHNNPPQDPIEAVTETYADLLGEIPNWTDGEPVADQAGCDSVDKLIKEFRTYKSDLKKAGEERTKPLHVAWKSEVAAVKVYTEDADVMQAALVATVAPFKAKKVAEIEAAKRKAWQAAEDARKEAEAIQAKANAADLDAQREIQVAKQAVIDAEKAAQAQSKETAGGVRTVTKYEIEDMRALVNDIARNDKEAMAAFAEEYVRKNHKHRNIDGVRVWKVKEAY